MKKRNLKSSNKENKMLIKIQHEQNKENIKPPSFISISENERRTRSGKESTGVKSKLEFSETDKNLKNTAADSKKTREQRVLRKHVTNR